MCQRWSGIWHMDTGQHSSFFENVSHVSCFWDRLWRSAFVVVFYICFCTLSSLSWSTPVYTPNFSEYWAVSEEHKEWCCDKFSIGCLGFSCCFQKLIPKPAEPAVYDGMEWKTNWLQKWSAEGWTRVGWKFGRPCFCVLRSSKVIHPISAWKTLTIGLLAPWKLSIQIVKTGRRSNHALSAEQLFRVLNRCRRNYTDHWLATSHEIKEKMEDSQEGELAVASDSQCHSWKPDHLTYFDRSADGSIQDLHSLYSVA